MSAPQIILIESDPDFSESFSQLLELDGYSVSVFKESVDALKAIEGDIPSIVFVDVAYRRVDAEKLSQQMAASNTKVPLIILADYENSNKANGLQSFAVLNKPLNPADLFDTVSKAAAALPAEVVVETPLVQKEEPKQQPIEQQIQAAVAQQAELTAQPAPTNQTPVSNYAEFEECLPGRSASILGTRARLVELSNTDDDILIIGESGLFKKDIAQEIYTRSSRQNGPFIAVKSDSFSPEGFEEELLGIDSEVLSASSGKKSLLDQSLNGILYIEDVDKLTLMAQASLINIIASRTELRQAGLDTGALNFRLIVSASQNLRQAPMAMNENLVAHLERNFAFAAPLRERGVDAVVCFDHYLNQQMVRDNIQAPEHSARLMRFLMSHPWPGNVAEVRNAAQQYANELRKAVGIEPRDISNPINFANETVVEDAVLAQESFKKTN
jgi:two-component system C4-dicarboxylate transport response regulator DctD